MFSLSRYRKQIMSVLMALVMAGSICFFEPMTVNAAQVQETGQEFYLHYAQPSISDNQGYVNILCRKASAFYVETIYWNLEGVSADGDRTTLNAEIVVNPTSWEFHGFGNVTTLGGFSYSLYKFDRYGNCLHLASSSEVGYSESVMPGTILGYMAYGNVKVVDNSYSSTNFTVYYSTDGSAVLLRDVIELLQWDMESNDYIRETIYSILNSVDGLENQLTSVVNYLKSVDDKLPDIQNKLNNLYDKLDEILEEEQKQTSWLERIWNSIQEFFSPSTEDQEVTDSLKENSQSQSNQLNDLNEQSKVEKVDPGSASASVDSYIDTAAVGTYGTVLSTFTGNNTVLQYLLIVFAVAFIGYVLFGKR